MNRISRYVDFKESVYPHNYLTESKALEDCYCVTIITNGSVKLS